MHYIAGESRRRCLPSYPNVPAAESLHNPNRRESSSEDLDGDDLAHDQRQAVCRRQARSSRHQGMRDGLHRR